MGWFWAILWVPVVMFVVSRVRRRVRFMRHYYGYGYGRHGHGFRGFHARGFHDHDQRFGAEGFDGEGFGMGGFAAGMRSFGHRRRGRMLFGLFRQIDASPGQEKAILKAVDEISAKLGDARAEFMASRRELGAALGGDQVDNAALDAAFLRNTELFVKLSRDLQTALVGVHDTLDSDQRKLLAELIAHGFSGRRPYAPHPSYAL